MYKAGGLVPVVLLDQITHLFQSFWGEEQLSQEFKDDTSTRAKETGIPTTFIAVSPFSPLLACKALACVLLNRFFRAGQGTVNMIFATRQLQKKYMEQHCDLFTTFVDLTNAFETVSRDGLWKKMSKFDCPHKFITIVRHFHENMQTRVLDDGESSESFPVSNGVKQCCVLAPTLLSLTFSAMLTDEFRDCDAGIRIGRRSDGKLFNLRRLQVVTKVKETCTVIGDFLFADDRQFALKARSEKEMQLVMDRFSTACDNFGLTISIKKTDVMFQPAPSSLYHDTIITVKDQKF